MIGRLALRGLGLVALVPVAALAADPPRRIDFNRDVRPILSDNCFACHGPDKGKRKADLRLDTKDGLFGSKDAPGPVVAGKPEESDVLDRLSSSDPEQKMPPKGSGKTLTDEQVATIRRWIAEGAEFKGHWSFLPPVRHEVPAVDRPGFVRNPIDRFLLERIAAAGLEPAPQADRATLIRRVSFDLTGLPPTRAEVDAFVNDPAPDAYEKLVDRLLASPHHAERLAVMWLDLVRYADSIGYHSDNSRDIWPYRDAVLRAFAENRPFDRFTVEQLAGDLLPDASQADRIASGYNRLLQTTEEGGAQAKEYTAKYAADRVRNVSTAWLGATMGCAECHDHKFDPFTTRDFYRMAAFFADIREPIVGKREPGMPVGSESQRGEILAMDAAIGRMREGLAAKAKAASNVQAEWEAIHRDEPIWTVLDAEGRVEGESSLRKEPGGVLKSFGKVGAQESVVISARTDLAGITAIRLEALPDADFPSNGPGTSLDGSVFLTEVKVSAAKDGSKDAPIAVPLIASASDAHEEDRPASRAIDGDESTGWGIGPDSTGMPHQAVFETIAPIGSDGPTRLTIRLHFRSKFPQENIGKMRLSVTTAEDPVSHSAPPRVRDSLAVTPERRTDRQSAEILAFFAESSPLFAPDRAEIAANVRAKWSRIDSWPTSLVSSSGTPRPVRILPRGNWMSEAGELVEPGIPGFLAGETVPPRRLDRLDLARWLVSRENPMTARAFVNRLWKLAFGQGISKVLDDLGGQGEWPSHPELLDWLAVEFMDSGWDVRHVVRLIVTSGAYRQAIHASPEGRERDPYNRLIAHQVPIRLDAEFVRDNALAVSGLLVRTVGGPSVKPYQPPGYWDALNFPVRTWQADLGDSQYRRGMYTHWQRTFPHPSLLAFDAPSREECTAERARSNIPQQALVLLNDPTYVEASRAFAERVLREGGSDLQARIVWAFGQALSRRPSAAEVALLSSLFQKHEEQYRADPEAAKAFLGVGQRPMPKDLAPAELAAWASTCRVLLNLHETITRP